MVDLALSDEQHALVTSFSELLAKHSSPERVRAAEPIGHDPALWELLLEVGAVAMAVAEDRGGWGAGLVELTLVAERLGAALAPVPVIEAQSAARLLASTPGAAADEALGAVLAGERLVTLAVRPARGGRATLVPAGAIADAALVRVDDRLVLVPLAEGNRRRVDNLAAAPLADVDVDGAIELDRGAAAIARFDAVLDEWLTLTASALVGMAEASHGMTCEYARERHTWGRPIGSYQAVAHPLADARVAIDGARLLAAEAAWALDGRRDRGAELAAMAFAFASETARDTTYLAVHFNGGYGFMLEHDAQLHYRRARGWARVWGDATSAYQRVADARYGRG